MGKKVYGKQEAIALLCQEFKKNNYIDPALYERFDVKRGLRNADGTGVLAGLTLISNVHGYVVNEGEREPIEGQLIYRGYDIHHIVDDCLEHGRFGYEEVVYLLLFGVLPTAAEIDYFKTVLAQFRPLPDSFVEDIILKSPSKNIMNKMAAAILALYTHDDQADNNSIEQELRKAIEIIARMPTIMVNAYQAKRRNYDNASIFLHPINPGESTAESILSTLRPDRQFSREEAQLLDLCLMLHAEHGGGNNSTFACRVLTSSGTDAYSAYAAGIGSLKGPRHGGANIKVMQMLACMKDGIRDWDDEEEVAAFLRKIVRKEAGDGSGLIYGMGHAVYTKSDPRAVILKKNAMKLAVGTEYEPEFKLLMLVEKLAPAAFAEVKKDSKVMCANVDLYSGLVYKMLGIPEDLFTPLFAVARIAGWSAHRMEEILTGGRIIRPGYKQVTKEKPFVTLADRT
ncbi:MAG TPA: citrate/2-methylcitrate synthase [Firmicutes bacterium]|nr:citrate/2-methylcitrate synthase [Bacillota bacterium]